MKVKEVMHQLNMLNPERDIEFRAYTRGSFTDFPVAEVRIDPKEGKLVMSNLCGVV